MKFSQIIIALICVFTISIGQILFKMIGSSINHAGTFLSTKPIALGLTAISIYGLATLFWINLLRSVPLVKAYPYMALSFLFVPLIAFFVLGERLSLTYMVGTLFIVFGVVLVGHAS